MRYFPKFLFFLFLFLFDLNSGLKMQSLNASPGPCLKSPGKSMRINRCGQKSFSELVKEYDFIAYGQTVNVQEYNYPKIRRSKSDRDPDSGREYTFQPEVVLKGKRDSFLNRLLKRQLDPKVIRVPNRGFGFMRDRCPLEFVLHPEHKPLVFAKEIEPGIYELDQCGLSHVSSEKHSLRDLQALYEWDRFGNKNFLTHNLELASMPPSKFIPPLMKALKSVDACKYSSSISLAQENPGKLAFTFKFDDEGKVADLKGDISQLGSEQAKCVLNHLKKIKIDAENSVLQLEPSINLQVKPQMYKEMEKVGVSFSILNKTNFIKDDQVTRGVLRKLSNIKSCLEEKEWADGSFDAVVFRLEVLPDGSIDQARITSPPPLSDLKKLPCFKKVVGGLKLESWAGKEIFKVDLVFGSLSPMNGIVLSNKKVGH